MSDFKIGFRNLVHRFTGACFQASFGPWEERDFQQGGLLGEFCNFERIRSSKKSSKLRWCYADIFINQSGDWYEFHEWARHFMIQLRFPKALALSKVSRCFFYREPTHVEVHTQLYLYRTNRHRGAWVSVCDICVAHEVRDLYATWWRMVWRWWWANMITLVDI